MFTPYDWQEGIGNRAQYIEGRLAQGAAVLGVSLDAGILLFTYRRQARKIYEIYDRLIFAAVGQQSDVDALRTAALEFASKEGYNRSEEDVTIQRVATAMSAPIKRAFGDFSSAPVVARSVFGEVNERRDDDLFYVIDYDGDYAMSRYWAAVVGTEAGREIAKAQLAEFDPKLDPLAAVDALKTVWLAVQKGDSDRTEADLVGELTPEAVLLERSNQRENRFRILTTSEF